MGLPDARAAAPGARVHLHAGDAELYASFGLPLPGPLPTAASRVLPLAGKLAAAAGVGRFNLPPVDAWLEDGCAAPRRSSARSAAVRACALLAHLPAPPLSHLSRSATVAVGAVQLRVMHTPGHSRGHVVLYEADARVLFGGDLLIGRGVGRWDMPGGDAAAVSASAARTCAALPADATVLSGHAGALTVATYRRINARCAAPEATQRSRDAEL
jgi:glyoxylase-like metal-dependent hydrolase (beta-lactamase superfamily II)